MSQSAFPFPCELQVDTIYCPTLSQAMRYLLRLATVLFTCHLSTLNRRCQGLQCTWACAACQAGAPLLSQGPSPRTTKLGQSSRVNRGGCPQSQGGSMAEAPGVKSGSRVLPAWPALDWPKRCAKTFGHLTQDITALRNSLPPAVVISLSYFKRDEIHLGRRISMATARWERPPTWQ